MNIPPSPPLPGIPDSFFEQIGNIPYLNETLRDIDPVLEDLARTMQLKIAHRLKQELIDSELESNTKKVGLAKFFLHKAPYLLPPKTLGFRGFSYTEHDIWTWKELLTCPLGVSDEDLSRVIRMIPMIHNQSYLNETGDGNLIFMASWSFSSAQLDHLIEYLRQEEITFEELQTWSNFIASQNNYNPNTRITVRYIGRREVTLEDPLPFTSKRMMRDEFNQSFCGVLPEFLEGVSLALSDVAKDIRIYMLPDFCASVRNTESIFRNGLIYRALLIVFNLESLINREKEPLLLPDYLPRDEFSLLKPVYHGNIPTTTSKTDSFVIMQKEFGRLFQEMKISSQCINDRQKTTKAQQSLIYQAVPFEPEGGRPLLIFAVKGISPGDYFSCKNYIRGQTIEASLMKILIEEVLLQGQELKSNIIPFHCFAPFYRRFNPKRIKEFAMYMWDYVRATRPVVFVTLGKRMAEVVHGAFCTDRTKDSESPPIRELGLGSPRIITLSESTRLKQGPLSFIHIPLLDPGRYKYTTMAKVRKVFLSYMKYSLQYVTLVVDTAMILREEMRSSGRDIDEGSTEFCEEIILRVRHRLRSTVGRPFVEGIREAKFDIAELITQQPLMFC